VQHKHSWMDVDQGCIRFDYFTSSQIQSWEQLVFLHHRTICKMKLMASTMLSASVKRQYNSVVPLLHQRLSNFGEMCVTAMNFVFFIRVTVVKIEYVTWEVILSVLSLINLNLLQLHWHPADPARNLAGFPKNGRISDLPEPKSGITLICTQWMTKHG